MTHSGTHRFIMAEPDLEAQYLEYQVLIQSMAPRASLQPMDIRTEAFRRGSKGDKQTNLN